MATPAERFHCAPAAEHSAEEIPAGSLITASEAAAPDSGRPSEVIRRADSAGNFGLARARYSAGRWLAGQLVVVRCAGDVVEIYHQGELVKAHPRKHAKEKEETMSRTKRRLQASREDVG